MQQQVPIPTGSYSTTDPRASGKRLVGCFSELAPANTTGSPLDAKSKAPPIYLRRAPGVDFFAGLAGGGVTTQVVLTSGSTWAVPINFNSAANTIEAIGGGGAGTAAIYPLNGGMAGGGGGAYAKIINAVLTPGSIVNIQIGQGGQSSGANGTATFLQNSNAATIISADYGRGASAYGGGPPYTTQPGIGGQASNCIGTTTYSGGTGGGLNGPGQGSGGGGGGAAGPHGAGATGGNMGYANYCAAGGGGGGGGGSVGSSAGLSQNEAGGNGGNNYLGAGFGAGGASTGANGSPGTVGGGGGGGGTNDASPYQVTGAGAGGAGIDWVTAGAGGGGGGSAVSNNGGTGANPNPRAGNGGLYGGGGGGSTFVQVEGGEGYGAQGVIVVTYVSAPPGAVRGMNQMNSQLYAVIGSNLYAANSNGSLTLLSLGGASIPGNSFVRMVNNGACLFILVPGTSIAFTYCPNGGGFAAFTNPYFTGYGAIDVGFCDSYFIFLALNGKAFYNDDGQVVSGQGPPTFVSNAYFPREYGTDLLYGVGIEHRFVTVFGQLTSESYINTGNQTNSPFSSLPDTFTEQGVHPLCGYTVAKQDQTLFWISNDRTVRRKNGQTPIRVSNSAIEQILETANLTGAYALTPTVSGHPWVVFTLPAISRTLVFDCLTTEWFELESLVNNLGYWRPLCWCNAYGTQFVGDSVAAQIGLLDSTATTEFNSNPIYTMVTTQSIYDKHNRITHRRLELILTCGGSTSISQGAFVTLFSSDDSGQTWIARETKSLGALGQRQYRAFWTNLGQSRDRSYKFQISDPSPLFTVDVTADLDGGKW